MNFKKTWFGYINFILVVLLAGASVIALVFLNLYSGVSDILSDPLTVIKEHNGINIFFVLFMCILTVLFTIGLFVLLRQFRTILSSKHDIFRDSFVSDIVGGSLSLGLFAAGLFLRTRVALRVHDSIPFDSASAESFFNDPGSFKFTGTASLYEGFMAFLYRFIGIRPEAFVWVNLVLQVLTVIAIYIVVKNVLGSGCLIVPMAFMNLSPKIISYISTGSAEVMEFFICSVIMLILIFILSLFKEVKYFDSWGMIPCQVIVFICIFILPVFLTGGLDNFPKFDFNSSFGFVRLFSFPEIEYIDVIVMCLILVAAVSFIFSKYDRLMTISLIWLFSSVFYLYCENKWPSDFTMTLLFSVLAGLGLDEMFLSTVYDPELALKESVKNKPVAIETDAAEDQTVKEAPAEAQVSEAEVSKEASINDRVQEAEAVKEQDNSEKIKAGEAKETEEASENTEAEEVKEEEEVKEVKEVKLFDNPLPVPKPHVRKEISYSFEPDESMMKFDLDISENDDFDI